MQPLSIGKFGWVRQARIFLDSNTPFVLIATGWRAKLLRRQLPLLQEAEQARRQSRKVTPGRNFSVLTMWLLLSFHSIWVASMMRGFSASWEERSGDLIIQLLK